MPHTLPFSLFNGFSAVASLSLATDGAVDLEHLALAHAYDAAQLTNAPRPARIGRVTLKPAAIVSIMAKVIEKATVRSGTVHRADFRQLGLREDEIDLHFRAAFVLAASRQPALFEQVDAP